MNNASSRALLSVVCVYLMLAIGHVGAAPPTTAPAAEPAVPSASLITLHVKNAHPEQVYRDVFHQAGIVLRIAPTNLFRDGMQPIPLISIDVDKKPFWQVMQQLYDITRLSLFMNSPNDYRLAHTMPIFHGPQSLSGPFLFVAEQFEVGVNLKAKPDGASAKQNSSMDCGVLIVVYTEPGFKVLKMSPIAKVDQAEDDHGNSMVPTQFNANDGGEPLTNNNGWPQITAQLKFPDKNPGKHVTHMHGTETIVVADHGGQPEKVTVPFDFTNLDMNLQGE